MVSYDPVAALARFAKRRRIGYTFLSDPKSEIIRAFDLLDRSHPPGSPAYGIAHPIVFVVNSNGVITHRFSERVYTRRPDIGVILNAIRRGG